MFIIDICFARMSGQGVTMRWTGAGMTGWSLEEGLDDNNKNFYLLLEVNQRSFLKNADNKTWPTNSTETRKKNKKKQETNAST